MTQKKYTCGDCPWSGGYVAGAGTRRVYCNLMQEMRLIEVYEDEIGRDTDAEECPARKAYRVLRDEVRRLRTANLMFDVANRLYAKIAEDCKEELVRQLTKPTICSKCGESPPGTVEIPLRGPNNETGSLELRAVLKPFAEQAKHMKEFYATEPWMATKADFDRAREALDSIKEQEG